MDMRTGGKGQMSAEARRKLLLEAALEVMKERGVAAASTRAICERAGMPHGAFHYCFGSKKELFAALLTQSVEVPLEGAWGLLTPETSPSQAFRVLFRAYWEEVSADPSRELVLSELTHHALRDEEHRGLPAWESQMYRERIAEHLRGMALRTGSRYRIPELELSDLILTLLLGATTSWLAHRSDETALRTLDHAADLLAQSVVPGEEAARS
jgi:AcrR family transcriptional regulator